jgi:hypothetical protein
MFTECDGVCSNTTRRRSQWEHVGHSAMLYLRLSMEEFDSSKRLLTPGADDLSPLASQRVAGVFTRLGQLRTSDSSDVSGQRGPGFVRVDFTDYAQTIDTFFWCVEAPDAAGVRSAGSVRGADPSRRTAVPDRDRRHQVHRGEGHPVHYRAPGTAQPSSPQTHWEP